ncbi:MAG: TonB-dependent receptor plug domain-containing protein [Deltaproteobacteria bacterium]|nr:TonB-dependent receptor plug domain-containing protein [Deltaproteobacteria bacterium]MBW2351152.1 TonB-dependent receptor plug domain-containing protein [Deltaproteobacteria bacterium]
MITNSRICFIYQNMPTFMTQVIAILSFLLAGAQIALAIDTSLLFVGEDLSVLTIASRRAEPIEQAPAVAQVITKEDLERNGVRTLGEALSMLPGFYMSSREWGTQPYLRGVSNSILFLYDSVPLTSDNTKTINPLDEELSLYNIERIEVIRGPGSVLWGPDAFAGIVNIVPKQGRDVDGVELNLDVGTPDHEADFNINWGKNAGLWEAFLSISATRLEPMQNKYNVVRFEGDESSERLGYSRVDDSKYLEAVLNFSWQDWLHISGRWSDAERPYVLGESETDFIWAGKRESPFRFVRLEMERPMDHSDLRFNAYYNELDYKEEEINLSWTPKSHVSFGEVLYDRELWDTKGLFTVGASYRYNKVTDAIVRKDPLYFGPDNILFTPQIEQEDFNTSLWSIFGQVRHHWNHLDAWLGLRLDNHSQYNQTISHNMGISWFPRSSWYLKLLYGTAYRTPYNQELVGRKGLDPEQIQNLSMNLTWHPYASFSFSATIFWNEIRHHIQEEPYGGFSKPGSEDIYGGELDISWQVSHSLRFWANTTLLSQDGDKEKYKVLDHFLIKPDGTREYYYSSWETPFDTGPENLLNIGLLWSPLDRLDFSTRLQYADSMTSYYKQGEISYSTTSQWLLDTTITVSDVLIQNLDIQLALKNVFNRHYKVSGTYSPTEADPFEAYLGLKWRY